VKNPAHSIVDSFRLRESLVATLVSNDPNSSAEETSPEAVDRPERESRKLVRVGMTQVVDGGIDEGIDVLGGVVAAADDEEIPEADRVRQGSEYSQ